MSLASAFNLSRLSADLTYDLNRSPEVPEETTVQCAISRGKIMVLVESSQVETLIRHRLEIDGLPIEAEHLGATGDPIAIKVFLKQRSQEKPTAVHRFNWLLQDSSEPINFFEEAGDQTYEPLFNNPPQVAPRNLFETDDADEATGDLSEEEFLPNEALADDNPLEEPLEEDIPDSDDLLNLDGLYDSTSQDEPVDMGPPVDMAEASPWEEDETQPEEPAGKKTVDSVLIGTGIGLAVVMATLGYGLSRPCVIGGCDRIEQAQSLGDAALISLKENPTPETVLEMGDQLNTAVRKLRPIPPWSRHRTEAQRLLAEYRGEADLLNTLADAQETALVAAQESQDPPHPIAHWNKIAERWRETITQLEEIPAGSPVHGAIVVPKLQEYKNNLAAIEKRAKVEQTAEESLNQAQLTAFLAKNQADIANTLSAWETSLQSWDKAVKQLKQVPQGTMPYGETRKLLPQFEADLAKVRTRYQQEQAADQFYNEAVRHAATARQYESEEQWTLAMLSWRDAITQIKAVSMGSSRFTDSQNLLKTYEPALTRAQENLRLAIRFDKAKEDFTDVCKSSFCRLGFKGGAVHLTLAEQYDALADFSIADPNSRTSVPASDQMIVEVNTLLQELINIGKRTQLPIELYGADGGFIARFSPELEGYVKTLVVR